MIPLAPAVIDRELPNEEAGELLSLTRDLVRGELLPQVNAAEAAGTFPRQVFTTLGAAGLLSLPYPEEFGGGAQPSVVYLQVIEELARAWLGVAMGASVHVLACHGLVSYGSDEQKQRYLPELLSGELLGAYCLSEPQGGSDPGAMITNATRDGDHYVLNGEKAWITHGSIADFFLVMARTGEPGPRGISSFLVPGGTPGVVAGAAEKKMGVRSSVTSSVRFDHAEVDADRRLGAEGQGFSIAMSALDSGRLGIAACAVGVAQAALDVAAEYARTRRAFGSLISDFQGVSFPLADAASRIAASRQLYLYAARRKDAGKSFSTEAAMAKLIATDMAMAVTTDMVQVLGGAGYVEDYPVERYMREAKLLQIVEGTNQIQRLVIARSLNRTTRQARTAAASENGRS
ncbi:acyl-CoA dehydrogenase family protein [Nakamurella sp. UYEF19]|uniref:acyl-CoA dehydrogenase family protein n=1 Tax=Nakamurella sp. UYEF19 TaxID=1756392 RepID=UPI003392E998